MAISMVSLDGLKLTGKIMRHIAHFGQKMVNICTMVGIEMCAGETPNDTT
jgi:hypothetical protein